MTLETIRLETRGRVLVVTLNRPDALNAINRRLAEELTSAVATADANDAIGCILITGSAKAFAAGADIKEMRDATSVGLYAEDRFAIWDRLAAVRTPVVAAVAGHALGGGCELAMMCDVILAADTARFGQPEIKLGVIPGMGGTQRLARLVGKTKAMELCLTGRIIDSAEAERSGLVARVFPADRLMEEALSMSATIAGMSLPVAMMAKEAVNRADETSLAEGLRHERRAFYAAFTTEDQKEGMAAFIEKRQALFLHR